MSKRTRLRRPDELLLKGAAARRSQDVLKALASGANPNAVGPQGETALTLLAKMKDGAPSLRAVLDAGAAVDRANRQGKTALMIACGLGYSRSVRTLLRAGANPNLANENGETPLTYAVVWRRPRVVDALLSHGARPNHPRQPWTPLMYAAFEGDVAIARKLLSRRARPGLSDAEGRTAADIARMHGYKRLERLLRTVGNPVRRAPRPT